LTAPRVDLVILGGGPAGAAAAITAARRGLSVVLVDKARFPRGKLCGGLLSGRTARQIAAVFGVEPPAGIVQPQSDFIFSWKGKPFTSGTSPIGLTLTMRRDFDAWLLGLAEAAGVRVHQGVRDADPGLEDGVLKLPGGETVAWGALIGADGVNSAVARGLFGSAFDKAKIGFCLEAEVPYAQSKRPPGTPLQIDFGDVPWGYAWSFPKAKSVTLGLGAIKSKAGDLKPRMAALLAADATDPDKVLVKGHFIPFGDFRAVPGQGNVILAGDAAGLVDPLTGEGIAYAIESGALAAGSVADWLAEGRAGDLAGLYTGRLGQMHASLAASNHLAGVMHRRYVPAFLKRRLVAQERVQRKFFAILGGTAESSDLAKFNLARYLLLRR
jgi:menaquinone-9 beta-reductase